MLKTIVVGIELEMAETSLKNSEASDDIIEVQTKPNDNKTPSGIKRKKSPVWAYFTIQDIEKQD
jgi:hypothetical protein